MSNPQDNNSFDEPTNPTTQKIELPLFIRILKALVFLALMGAGLIVLGLIALYIVCALS